MEIVSTNIGERRTVTWKLKKYTTGIFKYPVSKGIFLGQMDVESDVVHDRKHHGGIDKACYLFSEEQYPFWKSQYPDLEWDFGMFGENVTVSGFDERNVSIGDTFKMGEALVQISEPRQPCSNLNLRFASSKLVKQFVEHGYCGAYLRVLKEGKVHPGDSMLLLERSTSQLTLFEIFQLLYDKKADPARINFAMDHPQLGEACRNNLSRFHKL